MPKKARRKSAKGTKAEAASTVLGFMDWVGGLRDDPVIRQGFERILRNPYHDHYPAAMKLMLAYAEGTPIRRIAVADVTPQRQETGQEVSDRVWTAILRLAQTNPSDRRVQVLAKIQGAEAKLAQAVPAEVVNG